MFGLIYMAANAIAYAISGTKTALEDHYHKERAIESEKDKRIKTNTYTDHRGSTRDISTNRIRRFNKDYYTGDTWLEDEHGRKLRNLSEEKRSMEFEDNRRNNRGCIAVKYDYWTKSNSRIKDENSFFRLTGDIYKDVANGDLYVKRNYIEWDPETLYEKIRIDTPSYVASFYMRVKDGMLVCLNDDEQPEACEKINRVVPSKEEVQRFIEFFNQKQREGGWRDAEMRERGSKYFQKKDWKSYYLVR